MNDIRAVLDNVINTGEYLCILGEKTIRYYTLHLYNLCAVIRKDNNNYIVRYVYKDDDFNLSLGEETIIDPDKTDFELDDDNMPKRYKPIDISLFKKYSNNINLINALIDFSKRYYNVFKNKTYLDNDSELVFFFAELIKINSDFGIDKDMMITNNNLLYYEWIDNMVHCSNSFSEHINKMSDRVNLPIMDTYSVLYNRIFNYCDQDDIYNEIIIYNENDSITLLLNSILNRQFDLRG